MKKYFALLLAVNTHIDSPTAKNRTSCCKLNLQQKVLFSLLLFYLFLSSAFNSFIYNFASFMKLAAIITMTTPIGNAATILTD